MNANIIQVWSMSGLSDQQSGSARNRGIMSNGQSTYPLDWVDIGWTVGSWPMPLDASLGSAVGAPCVCQTKRQMSHSHRRIVISTMLYNRHFHVLVIRSNQLNFIGFQMPRLVVSLVHFFLHFIVLLLGLLFPILSCYISLYL